MDQPERSCTHVILNKRELRFWNKKKLTTNSERSNHQTERDPKPTEKKVCKVELRDKPKEKQDVFCSGKCGAECKPSHFYAPIWFICWVLYILAISLFANLSYAYVIARFSFHKKWNKINKTKNTTKILSWLIKPITWRNVTLKIKTVRYIFQILMIHKVVLVKIR